MHDDLLGVRQELSVPGEVSLLGPSSWNKGQRNEGRQEKEVGTWEDSPASPETKDSEIGVSPFKSPVRLLTLVEEYTVLMGLYSIEIAMSINY